MSSVKLKDSGIAWIGKIPQHWEVGKVKHYYKMRVGFTPTSSNSLYYDEENGHTWITISDMKSKIVSESSSKISALYIQEKNPKIIPKNSLLYSFKLSVGVVAFNEKEVYTNEAIASFLDGENVNLSFLYYSSRLIAFNANENIYGAKLLNQELIKNAKIVFPPLQEQEAIAKFLDEKCQDIDALIATHQESIEKLRDYRTSLISETITQGPDKDTALKDSGIAWIGKIPQHWEIWRLKFLARTYTGNSIKDEEKDFYTNTENAIPYIATKDICRETRQIDYENGLYIPIDNDSFKRAKAESILLCIEGGNAGRKIGFLNQEVCFVNKLCCIEVFKNHNAKWLFFALQSKPFSTEFELKLSGLISGVSVEKLKCFSLPLPPLQEQEAIAKFLDEKCQDIDALIATHQESIEKLRDYRTSLISEVIVGQHQGAYQ